MAESGDQSKANQVQHLPFESVWKMRIDHPYSLFVREGNYLWSCGQCPLNEAGEVLHPNDLFAQARAVTGFIDRFLRKVDANRSAVTQLVVYHVKTGNDDGPRLQQLLHEYFGSDVLVLPVVVPHFYYDGMMIEVDVHGFVGEKTAESLTDPSTETSLDIVRTNDLIYAMLLVPSGAQLGDAVHELLTTAGLLDSTNTISEQWFVTDTSVEQLDDMRGNYLWTEGDVVGIQDAGFACIGYFTLAAHRTGYMSYSPDQHGIQDVKVTLWHGWNFFEVIGACTKAIGLVEETRRIMRAIEWALNQNNLSFKDIRKSTTHYIAGSSADELHDNMRVRNAYYTKPGPASTGLPVESFPGTNSSITVRIFGTRPDNRLESWTGESDNHEAGVTSRKKELPDTAIDST